MVGWGEVRLSHGLGGFHMEGGGFQLGGLGCEEEGRLGKRAW